MRRYKAGMNEIKADETLKQQIREQVKKSNRSSSTNNIKKVAMVSTAASLFILVIMFGFSYYQDKSQAIQAVQSEKVFHGIYLTASSASGTPYIVKPNVPFGKYQLNMSSVPGFPLKIECVDGDRIQLQASEGSFNSWSPLTSIVVPKGKEVDIQSGDTIYYYPGADSTKIEIIVYKNNKELGRNTVEITKDDNFTYTGKLLESE